MIHHNYYFKDLDMICIASSTSFLEIVKGGEIRIMLSLAGIHIKQFS